MKKEGACSPTNTKPLSKMGHLRGLSLFSPSVMSSIGYYFSSHPYICLMLAQAVCTPHFLTPFQPVSKCPLANNAAVPHVGMPKAQKIETINFSTVVQDPRGGQATTSDVTNHPLTMKRKKRTKEKKTGRERGGTIHLRCRPPLAMFVSLNPRLPASPTYGCNSTGSQLKVNF